MNKALLRQGNKNSLSFDGVNDYVSVALSQQLNNFTTSLWFKWTSQSGDDTMLFENVNWWTNAASFMLLLRRHTHLTIPRKMTIGVKVNNSAGNFSEFASNTEFQDDTWYHVAVVADGTNIIFYVNSVVDVSVVANRNASISSVRMGDRHISGTPLLGNIDRVRCYSRPLSHDEIKLLYRGIEPSNTDLKLSYDFKEGTGTSTKDLSGNNNNGTLINGVAWSTDVPIWGGV